MPQAPAPYQAGLKALVGGRDPRKIQAATAKRIASLVGGVSPARLRRRPAPGKWSVAEIVAHLAEDEIVYGYRLRLIVGAPGGPVQGFDQDAWAREGRYQSIPVASSLALFAAVRTANLAWLKRLTPAQRQRHGIHSERGRENVNDMLTLMAGHDLNHLKQIEGLLRP